MNTGQKYQYQCQYCGNLQTSKIPLDIDGELYVQMSCRHCHKKTNHLWVGSNPEDLYFYGDITLDSRFYKYNTK